MQLDKGRRQKVIVGEAGASNSHKMPSPPPNSHEIQILSNSHKIQIILLNSHKIQIPHYALDEKGFTSGMGGRKGGGKNAQTTLFLSYLVRMAIFPSDILEPHKCQVSMCCCLDAIKGTALR